MRGFGIRQDARPHGRKLLCAALVALSASMLAAPAMSYDKKLNIIFLGGSTAEAFWQRVQKGFNQACSDLALDCTYRAPGPKGYPNPNETKAAVENAAAAKPDGLIVVDQLPEAMNGAIKAAVASGIPVILTNSGFGQQEATGALAFIGLDEKNNGRVGGELLKKTGAKHALVVTLPPGIPDVDNRTAGFIEGFAPGQVTTLGVPNETLYDTTKLVNTLGAAFQKDPSIDSAFSIGSCCSPALLVAREQLGDRGKAMHFGTIDLGDPALKGLVDHTLDFALDQQQYMQGYLPTMLMSMYLRYGITPATNFFPTGPGPITAANAAQIIKLSADTIR
jgi:simple sugar transport system substrate-binding protein